MNFIQDKLLLVAFLISSMIYNGSAQDSTTFDLSCEINKVYPSHAIKRTDIENTKKFSDIDPFFKPSWVRSYTSVNVSAIKDGKSYTSEGINDQLTREQLALIRSADYGSAISVDILYMPENNLRKNNIQKHDFSFTVDPDIAPEFQGGEEALNKYLQANALDIIEPSKFKQHNLTAVQFTIDTQGHLVNPQIVQSSKDDKVDQHLINMICKMPAWTPAEYGDGTKTAQDYVLSIGDHKSCTLNLLNIRRLHLDNE